MTRIASSILCVLAAAAITAPVSAHATETSPNQNARVVFSSCAKPVYPKPALVAKHEGKVTLEFLISAEGTVVSSKVATTSGYADLDQAAHDAIKLCKFEPAVQDGKAIQESMHLQYEWTLK